MGCDNPTGANGVPPRATTRALKGPVTDILNSPNLGERPRAFLDDGRTYSDYMKLNKLGTYHVTDHVTVQ